MLARLLTISVVALAVICSVIGVTPPQSASAQASGVTNRGLSISPIRTFAEQDSSTTKQHKLVIGNFTESPMQVSLSVKTFSVSDYTYETEFSDATDKFITFETNQVRLEPGKTKTVSYSIAIPANTSPGGRYYTLVASGKNATGEDKQQVQAASLLYLTVNGKLVRSGEMTGGSLPWFTMSSSIPYTVDVKNTGNVHYYVFLQAELRGLFGTKSSSRQTHLLLPNITRTMRGSIKSPVLPGIYQVTYGYTSDERPAAATSGTVLYLPPWAIAALVILAWAIWAIVHRRRKKSSKSPESKD